MTLKEYQQESSNRIRPDGRKPRPYSKEARAFAVSYAKTRQASGESRKSVLKTLGISSPTLSSWMGQSRSKKKNLRPVCVETVSGQGGLQLVTPGGYRLEGLTVETAAALLRSI